MKFTNFPNLSSQTLFVSLSLLSSYTYAADASDINVRHCTTGENSCGQVLVGAARIDFVDDNLGGIRWAGPTAGVNSVTLNAGGQAFGFTGCMAYLGETKRCPNGNWIANSIKSVVISEPRNGAYLNHFFAPLVKGETRGLHKYSTSPPSEQYVNVEGEGVIDSSGRPVIALIAKAEVYSDATEGSKIDEISLTAEEVKEAKPAWVPVPSKGHVVFTITPKIEVEAFNVLKGDSKLREVEYVLVKLQAQENNTSCADYYYLSFQDKGKGTNQFTRENYYHYLEAGGQNSTPQTCDRGSYAFLVGKDTSFQFQATNLRDTGAGYVEYLFYVNGHYKFDDPNRTDNYKGSWQSFWLGNRYPLVADFVTTSSPMTISLDGSKSYGAAKITAYQWQITDSQGQLISSPTEVTALVPLEKPDFYTVTLTVTDSLGKTATQQKTVPISSKTFSPREDLRLSSDAKNAKGEPIPVNSTFMGGISDKGGDYKTLHTVNLTDSDVDVEGSIAVDVTHVGQMADIVIYAATTLPSLYPHEPEEKWYYYMLDEKGVIQPWDKTPAELTVRKKVTLTDIQPVPMYNGKFLYPGKLKIYFGYRLQDGTVVTNEPQPIEVTINDDSTASGQPSPEGTTSVEQPTQPPAEEGSTETTTETSVTNQSPSSPEASVTGVAEPSPFPSAGTSTEEKPTQPAAPGTGQSLPEPTGTPATDTSGTNPPVSTETPATGTTTPPTSTANTSNSGG